MLGRVQIFDDTGDELTKECVVRFTREPNVGGDSLVVAGLDYTGWVFTTMASGPAHMLVVACLSDGLMYRSTDLKFDIPSGGRAVYFGHVRVDFVEDAPGFWDKANVSIADQSSATKLEYGRRYGGGQGLELSTALLTTGILALGDPSSTVARNGDSIEAQAKVNGVKLVWSATPAQDPSKVSVRFERDVIRPELSGCTEVEFVSDGRSTRYPVAYSADRVSTLTRESLRAELDLDGLRAFAAAQQAGFTLCALNRRLSSSATTATRNFVSAFEADLQRSPAQ